MILSLFAQNPILGLAWVIALFTALSVHEFAHAYAAYRLGDYTARDAGRLTLNPLKHIDLTGLLLLILVGFGWGKPVPVNHHNLRNQRWGPAVVSAAGPLSNLVLIVIVGVILRIVVQYMGIEQDNGLFVFLSALLVLNSTLLVFNLLPIPPLDGSHIFFAVLPDRFERLKMQLERFGPLILIGVVIFGGTLLSWLFGAIVNLFSYLIFV